jgi:uncharacterized protein (DUF2236 family)
VSASPAQPVSGRVEPVIDMLPYFDGISAFYAGVANVIMQLARREVGWGVMESKVESGRVDKHPFKRLRTTFTYISVAMLGDEEDQAAYREAVNVSHRQVFSGPDSRSPVRYNAFDPQLQLWVAACLYYGMVDVIQAMHGRLPDDEADAIYQYAARYGTGLQVPRELWPADREAFQAYWDDQFDQLVLDEEVRRYLLALLRFRMVSPVFYPAARFMTFMNTGFLPEPLRSAMGLSWTDAQERRFRRINRTTGAVSRRLPPTLRAVPFNTFLWDMRRRRRAGKPLV